MCCSSTAAKSPIAEFLQSQTPQERWKASLEPRKPFDPIDPTKPENPLDPAQVILAATAPGTGLRLDVSA